MRFVGHVPRNVFSHFRLNRTLISLIISVQVWKFWKNAKKGRFLARFWVWNVNRSANLILNHRDQSSQCLQWTVSLTKFMWRNLTNYGRSKLAGRSSYGRKTRFRPAAPSFTVGSGRRRNSTILACRDLHGTAIGSGPSALDLRKGPTADISPTNTHISYSNPVKWGVVSFLSRDHAVPASEGPSTSRRDALRGHILRGFWKQFWIISHRPRQAIGPAGLYIYYLLFLMCTYFIDTYIFSKFINAHFTYTHFFLTF